MRNRMLKAVIGILLIITLTISDFVLLGTTLISYATNVDSVTFSAYFKTEEGEVSKAEYQIDCTDMKLYLKIDVTTQGYFEGGVVTLNDGNNFQIKQDYEHEAIKAISGNIIYLEKITGPTEIPVEIELVTMEKYEESMLNKENVLTLTGNYVNGEDENTSIEKTQKVKLTLLAPSNLNTTLSGGILTNTIYEIEGKNKRIVQLELNSGVIENAYPIKESIFELGVPKGIEEINVITKGTYATDGEDDKKLDTSNYEYDAENKNLKIVIKNTSENGKISWKGNGIDSVIITMLLDESIELSSEQYNIKVSVKFYGEEAKQIEKKAVYSLINEADGIIRTSVKNTTEIYKGKMYSGEERKYNSTTNIEINYANLIETSKITETTTYRVDKETEDKASNVHYKSTTIKKSEILTILGESGVLTIKGENGEALATINKDTETDENGNIIITYPEGVKTLEIELTKAVQTGIIRLNHEKVIKAENYTREEIKTFNYLIDKAKVSYNTEEDVFTSINTLKDTTSEAVLTVVPQTISSEGNKEIKMAITLKTNEEKFELFSTPTIILTMPEGVTINSISDGSESALYGGLSISKLEAISENQIKIEISGTQEKYVLSNINTQINFTANVNINKLMANKSDTIKIKYTNKGQTHEAESEKINIVSSNEKLITHLKLENYNGLGSIVQKYSDNETEVKGTLPIENTEAILVNATYTIINNYDQDITMLTAITSTLTKEDANTLSLLNYAEQNITVPAGEMIVITKQFNIPEGLDYSEKADIRTLVEYEYSGTTYKTRNNASLVTAESQGVRDTITKDNKIQIETFSQLGSGAGIRENDEIYAEQVIKYIVKITNISNQTISNLKITDEQENGNIYDLKDIEVTNPMIQEGVFIEHRYGELDTNVKTFEIETLKQGETKEIIFRVVAKKTEEENYTTANIKVSAEGIEEFSIAQISNKVKSSKIKILTRRGLNEEVQLCPNASYLTLATIKNLTDNKIADLNAKIYLSQGLTYNNNCFIETLDSNDNEIDRLEDVIYNSEENYISFKITELAENEEIQLLAMLYIEEMPLSERYKNVITYLEVEDIISNDVISNIEQLEIEATVTQSVNVEEGQKIKNKDKVIISGKITNEGAIESEIIIKDEIHNGLEINKVTVIKGEERIDKTDDVFNNNLAISVEVGAGEQIELEIETTVNTSKIVSETIENVIVVQPYASEEAESNKIVLYVESTIDTSTGGIVEDVYPDMSPEEPEEPDNPEEPDQPDQPDQPEIPDEPNTPDIPDTPDTPDNPNDSDKTEPVEENYSISGIAYVDKNENGIKDSGEELKDIIVKIVDLNNQNSFLKDKNGNEIEVKTNSEGKYIIENVPKGKYNLVFKYDTNLYELSESSILKDYIIEATKEKLAITNDIDLQANKTIDIELIELKIFDLKIDKYITKVVVQTANELKTAEYDKKQLVREEIKAKYMAGATVLVEYTIDITNVGELAGNATKIIDYLPDNMKFHSELNTEWYMGDDGNLYNTSLANTQIKQGEKRTLKLILVKSMTEGSSGTTTNITEISDSMNIKNYADSNTNNNQSKADIIINTATGTAITYAIAIMNAIVIVAIGLYIINRKVIK